MEQQADELEALVSIYGDEFHICVDGSYECTFPGIRLAFSLPADYPRISPPVFEIHGQLAPLLAGLEEDLLALFTPGEVVLYDWIEFLREKAVVLLEGKAIEEHSDDAGHKERDGAGQEVPVIENLGGHVSIQQNSMLDKVISGERVYEKKSSFQAHMAPVSSSEEVEAVIDTLLENSKVKSATHPVIMAYRIEIGNGMFLQDYDDDGESAAGGRLLHLLQVADVRNVVIVVSRWYGGILLGPSRFMHITNTARTLLEECGYIKKKEKKEKKKKGTK